ncbi:origin recognition complex subunit 4 [Trichomonascus vanleenenianus]|uniref:origin recognition complex subunit 4 n=1 Tax=Trichomonascus vanleenenianus TaxID=2268995 RepID=UPI003EC9567A
MTVEESQVERTKQAVLAKLNGRRKPKAVGLEGELEELDALLTNTVQTGEGNSCIIMGARSAGKTLLVDTVLESLESRFRGQYIPIRLSGFAQTDDKSALREITRQIDAFRNQNLNEYMNDEEEEDEEDGEDVVMAGAQVTVEKKSVSETLQSLLALFRSDDSSSMAMIIVIDELDRFTAHSRQTLLYNLLDVSQSTKTGVAVVGVTAKMNIREMLEKRVRSRFSQRIYNINRPATIDQFWSVCRANVSIDDDEAVDATLKNQWNSRLQELYDNGNSGLYRLVEHVYYASRKDARKFNALMLYPVTNASPVISDEDIQRFSEMRQKLPDTESFVKGLSEIELALLISAARAEIKLASETVNFNIVYDEYYNLARLLSQERTALTSGMDSELGEDFVPVKHRAARYRVWSHRAAKSAWERLQGMQLVLPSALPNSGGSAARDELRMVRIDVRLFELGNMIGTQHVLYKWTRL